jgi:hypothetical protein
MQNCRLIGKTCPCMMMYGRNWSLFVWARGGVGQNVGKLLGNRYRPSGFLPGRSEQIVRPKGPSAFICRNRLDAQCLAPQRGYFDAQTQCSRYHLFCRLTRKPQCSLFMESQHLYIWWQWHGAPNQVVPLVYLHCTGGQTSGAINGSTNV